MTNAVLRARAGTAATDASGIVTIDTYRGADAQSWRRFPLRRFDFAMAAMLFVAALVVRWPLISRGETLLHSDEAIVGLMAQDIAAGRSLPIYFYGQRYMGALEAYVIAALSPLFSNPIHALRFGPCCFFAAMVAMQYLMLTRWFGRRGGFIGAATLLAASPMFAQWSISARGGYIEVLAWGTALLWAYGEWFAAVGPRRDQGRRFFWFGLLIGSGFWINPCIVLFIAPIVAHAALVRSRLLRRAGVLGYLSLPALALGLVLAINLFYSVWVVNGDIHSSFLMGLPLKWAMIALVPMAVWSFRWAWLGAARRLVGRNGSLIFGLLLGATPSLIYVTQTIVGWREMEPSLPLGLRPIWTTGLTLQFLWRGLPMIFGADSRAFLQFVGVGRDSMLQPLDVTVGGLMTAIDTIAAGAIVTTLVVLAIAYRREIGELFRLKPRSYSPAVLASLGIVIGCVLYVLGGCTINYTTIRYLIPLWVFVPTIFAAVFSNVTGHWIRRVAPVIACAAWAIGQWGMYQQLGAPHALHNVARRAVAMGIDPAVAEPLDAHLLSYLTGQRCRTAEFNSFWVRLPHFQRAVAKDGPVDYIVQTAELDRERDWIDGAYPGESPPETRRFLWPMLRERLKAEPSLLVSRVQIDVGYERIRLKKPLVPLSAARSKPRN